MWNTRISSRRASPVDLRGGLSGFVVDKFSGTLCVGRRGEYCSVVSSRHFQPGCDIGCVIFARFTPFTLGFWICLDADGNTI